MILELSLAYLRNRPLITALNTLLLALGVGMIILLLLASDRVEQRLTRDAAGIDLVIGAKGSPLQLILSSLYHADIPTGNIPYAEFERWSRHELVDVIIPLALGDTFSGARIVGTNPTYPEHYGAILGEGRYWQSPFEAVLGAAFAEKAGLAIGDRFVGSHGLAPGGPAHGDFPYVVVGILAPTDSIIDRIILTSLDSVWQSHGFSGNEGEEIPNPTQLNDSATVTLANRHPLAVTALLVQYQTPFAATQLPLAVNQTSGLQAAAPAWEMARLLSLIGVGVNTLRGFGLLLMASAALSLFVALTTALQERRHDLAVMRILGASPVTLWRQMLLEGLLLAALGGLLGVGLGHAAASVLAAFSPDAEALGLSGLTAHIEELYVFGMALAIGLLAAAVPAIQAYRTDIANVLATGRA